MATPRWPCAIPGRYPVHAPASHFRPVADIAAIVVTVGGRLRRNGMAPRGLWRSRLPGGGLG